MYASDYKEISALKALADKYNICILLIHHLRKQAADDPFQQIAGSNGLMGASDTSWVMQRKRMSQTASILVTGRDMDNKTLRLHEEKQTAWWRSTPTRASARAKSPRSSATKLVWRSPARSGASGFRY